MFAFLKKLFGTAQGRRLKEFRGIVAQVNEWDAKFQNLNNEDLCAKTTEFRQRLAKGETLDDLLPEAYAVVKGVCRRLLGQEIHVSGYHQKWDMVPYDVQILGAVAMHKGSIAEMMTGEGKTLTATLPLYLNSLLGKPVHLVTVNDYLAERDCQWMAAIFHCLGISIGALTNNTPQEKRKEIYSRAIVFGTASEFGFDYLRDNSIALSQEGQVQRGHFFAIIDETDSILIDEARTPLIISGPSPVSRQMYDTLQNDIAKLVKTQHEYCNYLAIESRKILETMGLFGREEQTIKIGKSQEKAAEEAYRKLWLVSKGTPRHKILKKVLENPDMRGAIDKWDIYYHSDQNKTEKSQALSALFIIVDERNNEYELTDRGIAEWDKQLSSESCNNDFVMMDLGYEYALIDENLELSNEDKLQKKIILQEEDAQRKERAHNIRQLLRAHLLMERDVDYIVQEGKIVIIDENTGRPQPGRRFSDGLHQAIEAKECVSIQRETQTYASVTLQNYFRMYEKLAGMTGTALTEESELKQIYSLDVLEIPTNVPCVRNDANDEIYMTEREKYVAILNEVRKVHEKGQPVLVGTESVEVSEKLSRIFKQNKLPHTVLNAKQHGQEAEIVAQAGQRGTITISTNMAGRGTDIKLGDGVVALGGLHVVGTTRHSSRRIDRQLRGRCARQGDPGSSQFFVSFEDSLMRLFASPRLTAILKRFRPPEGEPISATILNHSIETAQKRIEQRNFMIRKHTLDYDDVLNKQRHEIYSFRNEVIYSKDILALAREIIEHAVQIVAEEHFVRRSEEGGWRPDAYRQWLLIHFPVNFEENCFDNDHLEIEEIEKMTIDKLIEAFHQKLESEKKKTENLIALDLKKQLDSQKIIDNGIRNLIIRKIDKQWQEHLLVMDHLRSEVRMRTVGQKDPLMEFKHEAFLLFHELSYHLRKEIACDFFKMEALLPDYNWMMNIMGELQMETDRSYALELEAEPKEEQKKTDEHEIQTPVVVGPKVGRNDFCPCGSGKKYKKCCGLGEIDD